MTNSAPNPSACSREGQGCCPIDILCDHEPVAPCVADSRTDLAHDSAQDLLHLLVNTLIRPQFTGAEGCAKAPLRSEHDAKLCHESVLKLGASVGPHDE